MATSAGSSGRSKAREGGSQAGGARLPEPRTEHDDSSAAIEFAAAASHDLSTPLQLINGYAEILAPRVDPGDPEAIAAMRGIERGVARMRGLVDGLLVYARLGDDLPLEPVDSSALLADVAESLDHEVAARRATLAIEPDLPVVAAIPGQLNQAFHNLIANALKFQAGEPPRVRVGCSREPEAWHFTVIDNGVGIRPGETETIFELFQRGTTPAERPGSGIGLAIVRAVAERHGGRAWAESAPGAGSAFHFTIAVTPRTQ